MSPTIAAAAPILSCPPELPIAEFGEEIVAAIKASPVVIIAGEPGSGKTTQIPKFCLRAGRGKHQKIGCTQPRRIAAISMAARLREELGPAGEELAGYRIRFSDRTSRRTKIKFMTDGILLAEAQHDRELRDYDTIIVDEAHERSLNIDFLLGILKNLLDQRPDLKVIITSATIDTAKFSRHFGDAPVIQVAGRAHPVEIRYRPADGEGEGAGEESSYVEQAVAAVREIEDQEGPGDILVFMPTERDIREAAEILAGKMGSDTILPKAKMVSDPIFPIFRGGPAVIMPLYGRLSPTEQRRIFQPVKGRKIVIATNVAETSITVPGIRYVIDTGLARIAAYNPRARTYKLPVVPIARSACDQRAGRCGRVGPGICIRLYPEEDYLNRPLYTPPEIVRSNLAEVILRMTALQLGDPAAFPFVDPPSARAIRDGYQLLAELGALEPVASGATAPARLSRQGRLMSRLPLDPCISRMILEARDHNALREVCIIAAALSIKDPRVRPADKEKEADQAHQRFAAGQSDFLFYLKLWETSRAVLAQTGSQGKLRKFCASHFLSYQRMREWQDIHDQILRILADERGFSFNEVPAEAAAIHQALLSGNLRNIAIKKEKNRYQGGGGREVMIFPGSLLYAAKKQEFADRTEPIRETKTATSHKGPAGVNGRGVPQVAASGAEPRASARKPARSPQDAVPRGRLPQWIMAAEMVETTKLYARTVAGIEPEWIEPLARPLIRYSYSDPHWEKRRGQVVATERGTLFGLPVVTGRKVSYARVDREDARRLFIQSALVEGELAGSYSFLDHNRDCIARLQDLEERSRRRDLLVGDEEIYQFYERQLPAEVFDQAGLNRLLKTKRGDDFLRLHEEDLISREPEADLTEKFPATLQVGDLSLALSYHFEPGAEDDGLSVLIPMALAPHLRPEFFEWLVPGMLEEKIFFLLKNLPKGMRRHLVPIPQTAADLARALKPGNVSLYQSLSRTIYEMFSQRIPGSTWAIADLPLHLRCRFCLVNEQGKVVAAGRDLNALVSRRESRRVELPEAAVNDLRQQWERGKISAEQLPNIPERLPVAGADGQLTGYLFPGLEESGEQVNLRLFTDQEAARAASRQGLLRLYRREFSAGLKLLRKELVFPRQHWRLAQGFTGLDELNRQMVEFVLREIFATDEGRIPSPEEFQSTTERVRDQGLFDEARRLYALILEVLNERWEVLNTLTRLHPTAQPAGQGSAAALGLATELQSQLTSLVPPDFLTRHDTAGLARLPRYLKALRIRSERAHAIPAKDATKAAQLAPFQDRLAQYPQPARLSPPKKALLAEYHLMLEEYKVSLFAQELKTQFPVSPQRLEEKWREVEESV